MAREKSKVEPDAVKPKALEWWPLEDEARALVAHVAEAVGAPAEVLVGEVKVFERAGGGRSVWAHCDVAAVRPKGVAAPSLRACEEATRTWVQAHGERLQAIADAL